MRFIEIGDDSVPAVSIGAYCEACFEAENIPTTRTDVEIHYVYANNTKDYCHILLNWGEENVILVIVTKPQEQIIYGHYLLDMNKEYGLYGDERA